jgi:hypothetical protein
MKEKQCSKFSARNFKWLGVANPDGNGGVGFLVSMHLAPYVSVLKPTHQGQLWIKIAASSGKDADIFACVAYMPQETATKAEREKAWAALTESWIIYSTKGAILLLGDLNARIGAPQGEVEQHLLGPFSAAKERSENGKLLAALALAAKAVVLNGHSQKGSGQPWVTWSRFNEATETKAESMLDYVLVSPSLRIPGEKKEFGVDETDLDSDHHLTWAKIKCPRKATRPRSKVVRKKFKLRFIMGDPKGPEAKNAEYEARLQEAFEGFELLDPARIPTTDMVATVDATVADFIERVFTALRNSVGEAVVHKRFSRAWFDQECRTAIDERRKIYALYKENPSLATWAAYKKERLRVRLLIKAKKKEDWEKFLGEIRSEFGGNKMKSCWSKVNRLLPSSLKNSSHPIRRKDGRLATSKKERLEASADYREELGRALYRPTFDAGFKEQTELELERLCFQSADQEVDETLDASITPEEVKATLAKAGRGKAAGKDRSRNSMFKYGGEYMVELLTMLFNWLMETEITPTDWGHAVIFNLFKEGDPADLGNYRGIALISCLGKLYLALWASRLSRHMEPRFSEEQGGFRPFRATADQIATADDLLVRRRRAGKHTFLLSVDFRKAFDTVWRDGLWKRLWDVGVRGKAWRVIKGVYRDIRLSVLVDGEHTRLVPAAQGVRQGCPISPVLFDVFIDELVTMLKKKGLGLAFGDSDLAIRKKVAALMYADDVVLMADSAEELQEMAAVVHEFCSKWRIEVNTTKSQVMVVKPAGAEPVPFVWKIGGTKLKVVHKYKYLGLIFSDDLSWEPHSRRVVKKVGATLARLGVLLSRRELPTALKSLVWNSVAGSVLNYGAEVWEPPTKKLGLQLESLQHKAGVKILRLRKTSQREATRAVLGWKSLESQRAVAKLRFRGKLLGMGTHRLARQVLLELVSNQGVGRVPLRAVTGPCIRDDAGLRAEFGKLTRVLEDNHAPLEVAEEERDRLTLLAMARKAWRLEVARWATEQDLNKLAEAGRGVPGHPVRQARLVARALRGAKSLLPMPASQGVVSENGIRRRLLVGSAAVNALMAKTTQGRSLPCLCGSDVESIEHFVQECPLYHDIRHGAIKKVQASCECETSCFHTFRRLTDELARSVFLLGGPVDGLTPCAEANAFFDAMIIAMWKDRAERLEEKHGMLKRKRALRRKRPRPLDPLLPPVRKKRRRERGAEGPRASPIQSIRRFFNQNPQRELPTPPLCGGPQPRAHTDNPHNQLTSTSQSHVRVRSPPPLTRRPFPQVLAFQRLTFHRHPCPGLPFWRLWKLMSLICYAN